MFLKKPVLAIIILALSCIPVLWAGDSAVFVDLGFSQDGRTYMFGQYGVLSPSLHPWAELHVVDIAGNSYVPNGRISYTQNSAIRAGNDGAGVYRTLLANNTSLTSRYGINFQNQGLPLYISRDENPPARGETIDFRDFLSGKRYVARLIPTITGSGANVRSQFYITLEATSANGHVRNYTIGNPNFVRQRIMQYNIKRVLIDSEGRSIIFVIEMKRHASNGHDTRYMIEAVRL
ncbi:MAG: DUF2259 domain-containing protein [Treponema sp.]|nr:DUF2259 domain-containing protein [Treponema sp.]